MRKAVAPSATLCILLTCILLVAGVAHGQPSPPPPPPPPPASPSATDAPGAPAAAGTADVTSLWYYAIGKEMLGPVTADEIRRLHKIKTISAETPLWKSGMSGWLPVESVSDFSSLATTTDDHPTSGPTSALAAPLSRAEYGTRTRTLWFYAEGAVANGPVSADSLRRLREARKVGRNTLVWKKGLGGWARLGVLVALMGPPKTPVGAIPPPPVRAIVKRPVRTGVIGARASVATPTIIAKPTPRTPPLFRSRGGVRPGRSRGSAPGCEARRRRPA